MSPEETTEAEISEEEEPEVEELEEDVEEVTEEEVTEEVEELAEDIPEEEIIDERIYTVPLRKAYWTGSRLKRANRAIRILREFVTRHMKPEELVIQKEVNERIWSRGIEKPPRRVRIRVTKSSENLVRVYLAEG